ncbi:MAG: hypothetical protein ABI551_09345, partial [Polyangiaceae bacterium]
YYFLSGLPPYDGENQLATLHMLTGGSPPPPLPANVPPMVQDIVMRSLAFDVNARTSSAADLQRQLEQAMLACGLYTTTTDVAAFVGRELGDRAEARKQAITVALAAASARSAANTAILPTGSDSGNGVRPSPMASTQVTSNPSIPSSMASTYGVTPPPQGIVAQQMSPQATGAPASMPARAFPLGAASEAEHPISQVSNATLGSAAVAYPQSSFASPPKAPKGAMAAVLGGVICGLLVVGGGGVVAYQKGFFKPAAAVLPTVGAHQSSIQPVTRAPTAIASESIPPPQPIPSALPQPSASTASAVTPASSASASAAPEASAKHAASISSAKGTSHSSQSATSSKTASKPAGKSTDYGF